MFMSFFRKDFLHGFELPHVLFPPSEAMTTAESPELLIFQHSQFIIYKQNIQEFVGPAARHFGLFSVFCGLFIGVH